MSKADKLIGRFIGKPKDFTWDEAVSLMAHFGYKLLTGGNGSHRKFYNEKTGHVICITQPHPRKILKAYQINDLFKALKDAGKI